MSDDTSITHFETPDRHLASYVEQRPQLQPRPSSLPTSNRPTPCPSEIGTREKEGSFSPLGATVHGAVRSKLGFLVRGGGGGGDGGDGVGVPSFPFMSWIFQPRPLQPSSSFPPACLPACLPACILVCRPPAHQPPPLLLPFALASRVASINLGSLNFSASLCHGRGGSPSVASV